jgi:tetratricopeptide (TPR) repeat protein
MDYLEYAYLQSGRVNDAQIVLKNMNALSPVGGLTLTGDYALAATPARYALELGKWEEASKLSARQDAVPWAQAITWAAIGVGAARAGNAQHAAEAKQALDKLHDQTAKLHNDYWAKQIQVQIDEVDAWTAQQIGDPAKALTAMTAAANLEESMDKHAVTPGAIVPAREMLGQLLLEQKHPQEAFLAFQAVLQVAPKRFNALYGAATAADAAGKAQDADRYFKELIEVSVGNERPELARARTKADSRIPSVSIDKESRPLR